MKERPIARASSESVLTTAVCSGANKGSGPRISRAKRVCSARQDMGVCPPLDGPPAAGRGDKSCENTTVLRDARRFELIEICAMVSTGLRYCGNRLRVTDPNTHKETFSVLAEILW